MYKHLQNALVCTRNLCAPVSHLNRSAFLFLFTLLIVACSPSTPDEIISAAVTQTLAAATRTFDQDEEDVQNPSSTGSTAIPTQSLIVPETRQDLDAPATPTVPSEGNNSPMQEDPPFNPQVVDIVGHIGGASRAVAINGNLAFVSEGSKLVIRDISNPADPHVVGKSVPLADDVLGISVDGQFAYVAARSGLYVIDISSPDSPTVVSLYETFGWAEDVVVKDGYAYIADNIAGLQVLDVSEPSNPVFMADTDPSVFAVSLAVTDNFAYVAARDDGFRVVDISTPGSPLEVASYPIERAKGVAVAEGYAYVTDEDYGLHVFDISDPYSPTRVSSFAAQSNMTGFSSQFNFSDVALIGNYAYVTNDRSDLQLWIIDTSIPSNPVNVGVFDISGDPFPANSDVEIVDEVAYVADAAGLRIFDISIPTNPIEIGAYQIPRNIQSVATEGNYLYVADEKTGLWVLDNTDKTNPIVVGSYQTPNEAIVSARELAVSGQYAYISGESGGLWIVDIADPAHPVEARGIASGIVRDLELAGDYVYIANERGLKIVNISTPANPREVGFFKASGQGSVVGVWSVSVSGNFAYAGVSGEGLYVLDISNPENPVHIGKFELPNTIMDIEISGGNAYVATFGEGFLIIDISTPSNPTLLDAFDEGENFTNIAIDTNHAYIVDQGLLVFDISEPIKLSEPYYYEAAWNIGENDIAADDDYVYVPNGESGLFTLQYLDLEKAD